MATTHRRRSAWLRFGVGGALGLAGLYAVVGAAGGFADAVGAVRHIHVGWMVVGFVAELGSFAALAAMLRRLVGRHAGLSRMAAYRFGLVILGLGNVLPAAPAEGLALAAVELRRRHVEPRRIGLALGMLEWFTTRAVFGFLSLNFLAVLLLMQERHNVPHRWAIGGLALITLASLPVTAWLATRRETAEWVAMAVGRFRFWRAPAPIPELRAIGAAWHAEGMSMLGSFGNQAHLVVLGMVSCFADLTCLRYSLYAAGVHPSAGGLVVAYGAGIVGSLVPFLPAGLGAVEVIMPAVLHRTGVALAPALAGVLTYRLLSTVLPALMGTVALVRLRRAPTPSFSTQ